MSAEISKSQVSDMVKAVFERVLNGQKINEGFMLNDESMDSLTRVEIVMELEAAIKLEFLINESIPEQFTDGLSTVGELIEKLYHYLNQKILAGSGAA